MKTGAPTKAGVLRDGTNGRSRGRPLDAQQRDMVAVAALQRTKRGIAPVDSLDQLAGYPVGRLRLVGIRAEKTKDVGFASVGISEKQFFAATSYRRIVLRNAALHGMAPYAHAFDINSVGGRTCRPEISEETDNRIRGDFRDARSWLLDAGAQIGVGSRVNKVVYEIVIEERDEATLTEDERGWLRIGLNALARWLR